MSTFKRTAFAFLVIALLLFGCGEGVWRVGANGATAHPTIQTLPSSVRLDPGTKIVPLEKVSENSWRYEIKEGKYAGVYAVISENEVELK